MHLTSPKSHSWHARAIQEGDHGITVNTLENLPRVKLFGSHRRRCEFVEQLGIPRLSCVLTDSLNGTVHDPFWVLNPNPALISQIKLLLALNPNDDLIVLLVERGGNPQRCTDLNMWGWQSCTPHPHPVSAELYKKNTDDNKTIAPVSHTASEITEKNSELSLPN